MDLVIIQTCLLYGRVQCTVICPLAGLVNCKKCKNNKYMGEEITEFRLSSYLLKENVYFGRLQTVSHALNMVYILCFKKS